MLKLILRVLVITFFAIIPVFADDTLSTFNQQEDINSPPPVGEEQYFATLAPMPSIATGYMGLNLGGNSIAVSPSIVFGISNSGSQKRSTINFSGGIYGGYGVNISHFYLGAELSAAYNSLNRKGIAANPGSHKIQLSVRQPFTVGLDLIPGYLTQSRSVLFYGRLGIGAGLIKLGFNDVTNSVSNSTNNIKFGLRAGLGIEYFMNDIFGTRIEYIFSNYQKINSSSGAYSCTLNPVKSNQVNLGFSIHF